MANAFPETPQPPQGGVPTQKTWNTVRPPHEESFLNNEYYNPETVSNAGLPVQERQQHFPRSSQRAVSVGGPVEEGSDYATGSEEEWSSGYSDEEDDDDNHPQATDTTSSHNPGAPDIQRPGGGQTVSDWLNQQTQETEQQTHPQQEAFDPESWAEAGSVSPQPLKGSSSRAQSRRSSRQPPGTLLQQQRQFDQVRSLSSQQQGLPQSQSPQIDVGLHQQPTRQFEQPQPFAPFAEGDNQPQDRPAGMQRSSISSRSNRGPGRMPAQQPYYTPEEYQQPAGYEYDAPTRSPLAGQRSVRSPRYDFPVQQQSYYPPEQYQQPVGYEYDAPARSPPAASQSVRSSRQGSPVQQQPYYPPEKYDSHSDHDNRSNLDRHSDAPSHSRKGKGGERGEAEAYYDHNQSFNSDSYSEYPDTVASRPSRHSGAPSNHSAAKPPASRPPQQNRPPRLPEECQAMEKYDARPLLEHEHRLGRESKSKLKHAIKPGVIGTLLASRKVMQGHSQYHEDTPDGHEVMKRAEKVLNSRVARWATSEREGAFMRGEIENLGRALDRSGPQDRSEGGRSRDQGRLREAARFRHTGGRDCPCKTVSRKCSHRGHPEYPHICKRRHGPRD